VESEISKLTAFNQNGEVRAQGRMQDAQALPYFQAISDSSKKEYQYIDSFLIDVTS
jgi:hypothetical protein